MLTKLFLVIFPFLICPTKAYFSQAEFESHNGGKDHTHGTAYTAIRGVVLDLTAFAPTHYPTIVPQKSLLSDSYAAKDITSLFPVQVSALCNGKDGTVNPYVLLGNQGTNSTADRTLDVNSQYHDFRAFTTDPRPDWFFEQMMVLKSMYKKGDMAYSPKDVKSIAKNQKKDMAIIGSRVYDMTSYNSGGGRIQPPVNDKSFDPAGIDVNFMDQSVADLFHGRAGQDITKYWETLSISDVTKQRMKVCLDNLFYIGVLDTRNSPQCLFARYILLAVTILLVSVIGFKFLAALQFTKKNMPENLDKFVMCQIPVYTEDEESIRRALDSLARMKYDDKRKLIVIVCDGVIIGQGNDRSTPRIVLDILGVPESVDPEPLSFESLGEGQKQHNMGKVYSGLYEVQGHIVPFLVIVKVGKPSEVSRYGIHRC